MSQPLVVYLFHLIEFVDFSDGVPSELAMHPNLKFPAVQKIHVMRNLVLELKKRYEAMRTLEFLHSFQQETCKA